LKEDYIQQVLDCHAAELTEKDVEQVTALCEAYGADCDAVVERHQLTTSVLKKGLHMADNLVISLTSTIAWIGA
jgi:hypothetical protein